MLSLKYIANKTFIENSILKIGAGVITGSGKHYAFYCTRYASASKVDETASV